MMQDYFLLYMRVLKTIRKTLTIITIIRELLNTPNLTSCLSPSKDQDKVKATKTKNKNKKKEQKFAGLKTNTQNNMSPNFDPYNPYHCSYTLTRKSPVNQDPNKKPFNCAILIIKGK